MAQYTVTVVDTTQIQPYVFGSNRLQENIGASELVRLFTGKWALEAVMEVAPDYHNVKDAAELDFKKGFEIRLHEADQAAEVIYAGGGNIVVLFSQPALARAFAWNLTRKALEYAPGLSLVIAHDDEFVWHEPVANDDSVLSNVVTKLLGDKLAARKAARLPSQPLLGLGVTAVCEATGLVASLTTEGEFRPNERERYAKLKLSDDERDRLISRETACKLWARDLANKRLQKEFAKELSHWYEFPSDMDKLGRIKGEDSYVAVVHIDGNGMGKRIEEITDQFPTAAQNRDYIVTMRKFSREVNTASGNALRHVVKLLTDSITLQQGKEYVSEQIPMDGTYLPFRPLVYGGDDVTFVCNGLLGVALATTYLKAYEAETKRILNEQLYASAGISIVKMHYPFARAYALSEKLTSSAKNFIAEEKDRKASALDWHIAASGLSGSLDEIRRREYLSHDGARSLLMRPLLLHGEESDGRVWINGVEKLTLTFLRDEAWTDKRNKVKKLREVLREGLTRKPLEQIPPTYGFPEQLPEISGSKYQRNGWDGARCGYFDAIELSDYYVEVSEMKEAQ